MKKAGIWCIVFILLAGLFVTMVFAQTPSSSPSDDTSVKIEKGYTCAVQKVSGKCKDLTLDEQIFSLLALSYKSDVQDECKNSLIDNSQDSKCWPKGNCNIRETALAVLALKNIGVDTSQAENWLISQNNTPKDLTWYLQVDTKEDSSCKISYGGKDYPLMIRADKTLSQGAGSCLQRAQNNYWLQIAPSCLGNSFTVSCDKDFISSLIYKKTNSNIFYVSSDTQSAPSSGTTENKIASVCFGNPCDYEGSLWATLALAKSGKDTSPYLPYLSALATDFEKFLPSAFLYILTGDEEHFSTLTSLHAVFWDVKSGYGRFYDSALALLALQNKNAEQADATKQWLLDSQQSDGCWNNLRDTSFILYSAWPKTPSKAVVSSEVYCKDYNYFCISPGDCSDAGGEPLSNYFCSGTSTVCCNKPALTQTCQQKGGTACKENEECTGSFLDTSDTKTCCSTACNPKATQPDCEKEGNTCKSSCDTTEDSVSLTCGTGTVCCKKKEVVAQKSYFWVWFLVILIILAVLGIVFRNRIKMLLHKSPKNSSSGSQGSRFSPSPPFSGRPPVRPLPPSQRIPGKLRPATQTDKELDDTLKKLKEMSG